MAPKVTLHICKLNTFNRTRKDSSVRKIKDGMRDWSINDIDRLEATAVWSDCGRTVISQLRFSITASVSIRPQPMLPDRFRGFYFTACACTRHRHTGGQLPFTSRSMRPHLPLLIKLFAYIWYLRTTLFLYAFNIFSVQLFTYWML